MADEMTLRAHRCRASSHPRCCRRSTLVPRTNRADAAGWVERTTTPAWAMFLPLGTERCQRDEVEPAFPIGRRRNLKADWPVTALAISVAGAGW